MVIIVHEYMDIDDEKIYLVIPQAMIDYKEYIKQVDESINQISRSEP